MDLHDKSFHFSAKRIETLQRLHIYDSDDLLSYYPYRFDTISSSPISEWKIKEKVTFEAEVISRAITFRNGRFASTKFEVMHEDTVLKITIFNRPWASKLAMNSRITITGIYMGNHKVTAMNYDTKPLHDHEAVTPVYSTKEGIQQRTIRASIKTVYEVLQNEIIDYVPEEIEHKQVFGITFEQGRNELKIDDELLSNVVTDNKEIPESAKIDLAIALITLKYTQSNSVCFAKGGQAIGIGAGQQSRIHCTRLAGSKADNWFLRQSPQVMNLPFVDNIRRADRDNTIDLYIGEDYMDVLAEGEWQKFFKEKPPVFTREEKRAWLDQNTDVALGSDAFFPFSDNVERAKKSGVKYIAQPGGSVRDDLVIECADKYDMVMAFTGIRLFHH